MDVWVLNAQQWVNETYALQPGYVACEETGTTGWAVMHSLTRALQAELGIASLSDNFGSGTTTAVNLLGGISKATANTNLRIIVEAALYCKGYSGGAMDGSWGSSTQAGIASLLDDMGVPSATPTNNKLTAKFLKALLTMDAFTLLSGGRSDAQAVQRWMNGNWYSRLDYDLVPCDGLYSRNVQKGLVFAIQYAIGMADGTANGNFGPGTKDGIRAKADIALNSTDGPDAPFVSLFKACLIFNGYAADWGSTTFTTTTQACVLEFQRFCVLEESGKGDFATWASLLVSTGDPTRPAQAADCRTPLNKDRAKAIYDAGYRYIGRYINGGTQKKLSQSETALILNEGLSVVPIYQEYNNQISYFTRDEGLRQGSAAHENAKELGLPEGTYIYFPVDFDAVEGEVRASVVPFFEGVYTSLTNGGKYYPGVYGARNTCQIVSDSGYAHRSFVSGMSTGFSGNLGYPLPTNWAFDQVATKTLADGLPGEVEIDHDVYSGRDSGVKDLDVAVNPLDAALTWVRFIEARADEWLEMFGTLYPVDKPSLVAGYIGSYNSSQYKDLTGSSIIFGSFYPAFNDYVDASDGKPDPGDLICPLTAWKTDVLHMGASFLGALTNPLPSGTKVGLGDFAGWAGDLVQMSTNAWNNGISDADAQDWAYNMTGLRSNDSAFGLADIQADVDAVYLAEVLQQEPETPISVIIENGYRDAAAARARYSDFVDRRFGGADQMDESFAAAFLQDSDLTLVAAREAFWAVKVFGGDVDATDVYSLALIDRPQFFANIVMGAAQGLREKVLSL